MLGDASAGALLILLRVAPVAMFFSFGKGTGGSIANWRELLAASAATSGIAAVAVATLVFGVPDIDNPSAHEYAGGNRETQVAYFLEWTLACTAAGIAGLLRAAPGEKR